MGLFLNFGEKIDGYDYKVINERDARASAGIMFLLGILSLFTVHLYRTIFWAELFSIMTYYIIFDIITPVRLGICWLCLFLMYVESVFGICLGCLLYKKLKWKTYNCPGAICDVPSPPYNKRKLVIIAAFLGLFFLTYVSLKSYKFNEKPKIIIVKE